MAWYQTKAHALVLADRPLQDPKGNGVIDSASVPAQFKGLTFVLELRCEGVPALRVTIYAVDLDGKVVPTRCDEFAVPLRAKHLGGERFSLDLSSWVCPALGHYQLRVAAYDDPTGRVALVIPIEVRQR
jgi:hypothetical protein